MKIQYQNTEGETGYVSIAEAVVPKGDWIQLSNTSFQLPAGQLLCSCTLKLPIA